VVAAVHLAGGGWDSTAAVGLPVGFAATLVLVFVRRVPSWVTGEWESRPWSRSKATMATLALTSMTMLPASRTAQRTTTIHRQPAVPSDSTRGTIWNIRLSADTAMAAIG